jgi:hypothetical protein
MTIRAALKYAILISASLAAAGVLCAALYFEMSPHPGVDLEQGSKNLLLAENVAELLSSASSPSAAVIGSGRLPGASSAFQALNMDQLGAADQSFGQIMILPAAKGIWGQSRRYSAEFCRLVRDKLGPQGLGVFYVPLSRLSRQSTVLILRSIASAFPSSRIFKAGQDMIVLAGMEDIPEAALKGAEQRLSEPRRQDAMQSLGLETLPQTLALEAWLPRKSFEDGSAQAPTRCSLALSLLRDRIHGRSTAVDEILATPDEWRWSLIYSKQSLLARYLKANPAGISLAKIMLASCGSSQLGLIEPNWRYLHTACRDSMLAVLTQDAANTPKHLEKEFSWVRNFLNPETASAFPNAQEKLQAVIDEIYLFAQFDSIFLPLSPKRLIWRASNCYISNSPDHLFCRAELVKSLSYTGYFDQAQHELEALKRDDANRLWDKELKKLSGYLDAARSVK